MYYPQTDPWEKQVLLQIPRSRQSFVVMGNTVNVLNGSTSNNMNGGTTKVESFKIT